MKQNQINQIKGLLEEFSSIDLATLIATQFSSSPDLNSIAIGEYSAKEYSSLVNKVIAQFDQEIDSAYAKS